MLSTQLLYIFFYQAASFVLLLNQSYQLLHSSHFPSTFWILSSGYFLAIHSSRDVLKCLVIDLSVFLPVCLSHRHGAFGAPSVWPTYFTYWKWVNWFQRNAVSVILHIKYVIISPKDASSLILLKKTTSSQVVPVFSSFSLFLYIVYHLHLYCICWLPISVPVLGLLHTTHCFSPSPNIAFSFSSLLNASRLPSGANPVGDVSRKADYLLESHDFWRKFTHSWLN